MKENLTNVTNEEIQAVKLNKKGFSLVELIVVMAIMAILVGAVGMAVLPYIEKARTSKDMQVLSSICTSASTAITQNATTLAAGKDYVFTLSAGASSSNPVDAGGTKVLADLVALSGGSAAHVFDIYKNDFKSKELSTLSKIVIKYQGASTGAITVEAQDSTSKTLIDPVSSK